MGSQKEFILVAVVTLVSLLVLFSYDAQPMIPTGSLVGSPRDANALDRAVEMCITANARTADSDRVGNYCRCAVIYDDIATCRLLLER